MIVIFLLIPFSILIAVGFLGAFIWAVRSNQYEDTCTPAMRLLLDETCSRQEQKPGASVRLEQSQRKEPHALAKIAIENDNPC